MEWKEVTPLPNECQNCQEEECYNCDTAGKQWQLSEVDELRVRRKGLEKAVERLQRQIAAIDERLAEIEDEPNVLMTQEIWEHCVWVCYQDGDVLQLRKLLAEHPEYVHEWNRQYEDELNSPGSKLKQKEEDYWARLKPKLIEEFGEAWVAKNCKD